MTNKDLEKICRYAILRSHRRGEYALCTRNGIKKVNPVQCIGNTWYSTGHSSEDSYIDFEKVSSCQYRKSKRYDENKHNR